jgi:hypothetical protein
VAAQRQKHVHDHDSAHAREAEEVEVIEVSPGEYRRAREAALRELGLTYRELQAQARTGRFSSLRARKLWLAIGPHRTRSA